MKSSIKEESSIKIIYEIFLNDNCLLQFVKNPMFPITNEVRVRYIEDSNSIQEDLIGYCSFQGSVMEESDGITILYNVGERTIIEWNESAVAYHSVIQAGEEKQNIPVLLKVYHAEKHQEVEPDFKEVMYQDFFGKKSSKIIQKEFKK